MNRNKIVRRRRKPDGKRLNRDSEKLKSIADKRALRFSRGARVHSTLDRNKVSHGTSVKRSPGQSPRALKLNEEIAAKKRDVTLRSVR